MPLPKPKFPSLPGKSSKATKGADQGTGMEASDAALALQKFLAKKPPSAQVQPVKAPPGGYKPGVGAQQCQGEVLKDYSAMKPKLATKDKILNPVKKAVGLPGKAPKMVPKK